MPTGRTSDDTRIESLRIGPGDPRYRAVVDKRCLSEKAHLGVSLLLPCELALAVITLIEGDDDSNPWALELVKYAPQSNVSLALRLVLLGGQPNAGIWIVQDRERPRWGI